MKFHEFLNESQVWKYFQKKTDMPFYDQMMENPEYFARAKKMSGKITMMKPQEYLKQCAKLQGISYERTVAIIDPEHAMNIRKNIEKTGSKMPMPVLDYASKEQEGRHRAHICIQLGLQEMPVLVVTSIN